MNKLSNITRILIAGSALVLIATFFLPAWKILLWAPQYPEGLEMKIWLTKLSGDVKVINGLNHYIGMKEIHEEMFPEFIWLPYIVAFYIALGLAVSLFNRRIGLLAYVLLLLAGAMAALTDFYLWGYDYGHNLNPDAAIVVPGMAYQPPLLGYKVLLNFTALSIPDTGGWIFTAVGAIAILCLIYEFWRNRNLKAQGIPATAIATFVVLTSVLLSFTSCGIEPRPINYGKDLCSHCKMTLMDKRFGAEAVTNKGKVYVFDDLSCMAGWAKSGEVKPDDIALWLTADFIQQGTLTDATKAFYLQHPELKSPMASNIAGFAQESGLKSVQSQLGNGKTLTWPDVLNSNR